MYLNNFLILKWFLIIWLNTIYYSYKCNIISVGKLHPMSLQLSSNISKNFRSFKTLKIMFFSQCWAFYYAYGYIYLDWSFIWMRGLLATMMWNPRMETQRLSRPKAAQEITKWLTVTKLALFLCFFYFYFSPFLTRKFWQIKEICNWNICK